MVRSVVAVLAGYATMMIIVMAAWYKIAIIVVGLAGVAASAMSFSAGATPAA